MGQSTREIVVSARIQFRCLLAPSHIFDILGLKTLVPTSNSDIHTSTTVVYTSHIRWKLKVVVVHRHVQAIPSSCGKCNWALSGWVQSCIKMARVHAGGRINTLWYPSTATKGGSRSWREGSGATQGEVMRAYANTVALPEECAYLTIHLCQLLPRFWVQNFTAQFVWVTSKIHALWRSAFIDSVMIASKDVWE